MSFIINERRLCPTCGSLTRYKYDSNTIPLCNCGSSEPTVSHRNVDPIFDENGVSHFPAITGINMIQVNRFRKATLNELKAEAERKTIETGVEHTVIYESDAEIDRSAEEIRHNEHVRQMQNGVTDALRREHSAMVAQRQAQARAEALRTNKDPDRAAYEVTRRIAPVGVLTGAYQAREGQDIKS